MARLMNEPADNVRPHIKKRALECVDGTNNLISLEEYKESVMNSWEREWLIPYLSDEALMYRVEYSLSNCRMQEYPNRPPLTYDESVIHSLTPELLSRFRNLLSKR